jgi:hypothetical protein
VAFRRTEIEMNSSKSDPPVVKEVKLTETEDLPVNGILMMLAVDTGAAMTIINSRVLPYQP